MKIVREHINEKFTEYSDPIEDMGIGKKTIIKKWLDEMRIKDYVIKKNMTIDVHGSVIISNYKIGENFPDYIQFNKIDGNFSIQRNNFTTLRGCPYEVHGMFSCSNNKLKSLKYAPKVVHNFFCHDNLKKFTKKDILKYCNVTGSIFK